MASVKRRLALVTPMPKGDDVKELQLAVNRRLKHLRIDHQITVDGEFGVMTLQAVKQVAVAIGAGRKNRRALKHRRVTMSVQQLIRGLRKKNRLEKLNTIARKSFRRKLRKRYARTPGQIALAWARQQVGVTEKPAGSNWGRPVQDWIQFTGYTFPVSWCGCFACFAAVKVGGAKIPSRIRLGYAPYITADARAGRNGLKAVPFSQGRAGDIGTLWNGQHIALIDRIEGDYAWTVEGNTSSGQAGSQSNGGMVAARKRHRSDFDCIARPDYR